MLVFEFLSKMYLGFCEILKYVAPAMLLVIALGSFWIQHQATHIATLSASLQASETALVIADASLKANRAQAQQQGAARIGADSAKAKNFTQACKSKLKISTAVVALQPGKNLLKQVLPHELIKEIDPSYSPTP